MELNKQGLTLIEYLYKNNGRARVSQACEGLNVSKRALLYQVNKINDFFRANNLSEITVAGRYIVLSMKEKEQAERILCSQEILKYYFLSSEERLALITIIIGLNHMPSTTDSLCQKLDVSKNTLVADIAALKKRLINAGLYLVSSNKTGYQLEGDETTLRFYIIECIQLFYGNNYSKYYMFSVYKELFQNRGYKTSFTFLYTEVMRIMESFAGENFRYTKGSLEDIYLHITLMILRNKAPDITIYQEEDTGQEYRLAKILMNVLKEMGFSIQRKDENFLIEILLSSKRHNDISHRFFEDNLVAFTDHLIENFEKLAMIRLENKKEFINKLLLHIRPMYYRMKYGIHIHNVLNEEIQEKYAMFFHLTKKALELTDQSYFNVLPDDEISYLCIYFAGWINQSALRIEKKDAEDKILLVVSDGNSMSSLIQLQLINLLKPLNFQYEVISSQQFEISMAQLYVLVVGDIPNSGNAGNVIPVSVILTESQRNRILQWSIRFSGMNSSGSLSRLYEIIRTHSTIHDEEILKVKLFNFLNERKQEGIEQIPALLQIINLDDIFLIEEKKSVEQILICMTKDLVKKQVVKSLYPVNILHLLETMGAYGEISKGVLLLHAEDTSYCNKLRIRIGNLKYPRPFSKNSHEIHTVLLLSTPDKWQHLRILKNLSQLFRDLDFISKLENYEFISAESLYKTITRILSVEE